MARKGTSGFLERNRLAAALVGAMVALLIFSGWLMRRGPVAVRVERVQRQSIVNAISANGKIEPIRNFEAHAPAAATVRRVLVHEGDQVKQGQLLLELDDSDARAQSAKALAQLRAAEADLLNVESGGTREEILSLGAEIAKNQAERAAAERNLAAVQRLQQNGAASPAEVEAAQNRVKAAEAQAQFLQSKKTKRFSPEEIAKAKAGADQARAAYAAAQDALEKSRVTAPFAGTVYQLPVKAGSYVNAGDLLAQMTDLHLVQVRAFVDEPEIGRLAQGQKVEITWDAMPGRTWQGTLTRTPSSVTTVGTRSVGEITCEIPNSDRKLLPNVNVNVSIVAASKDVALTIPREALHDTDGKRTVYEVVDGKIKSAEVQVGTISLTRVEILSGLADGAEIALSAVNAQPLREGMEVKAVER